MSKIVPEGVEGRPDFWYYEHITQIKCFKSLKSVGRSPAPDSLEGARMREPELPRQTKPQDNVHTEKQKGKQNPGPEKRTNQRRKKASEKTGKRRAHPYDDAFRTLLKTCSPLILPVLNEMFGEHYTGKERIDFRSEQYRLNKQGGKGETRITDSTFTVTGSTAKHYLIEAQSTPDSSMLIRIFEYSTQVALAAGELRGDTLHVTIPQSGILFLRSSRSTPGRMHIRINTRAAPSPSMYRS
ncbi:MAG: hypothetical protein LUE87_04310 [Lachnospiraceae bacterium]|nr:hypothetical protein [Lachnospiraceae bacterium]